MYNVISVEENEAGKGTVCVCLCVYVNFSQSGQGKGLTEMTFEKDLEKVSN